MKAKSPQAHTVTTLKERLSQGDKSAAVQQGQLRTAHGFATA